MLDRGRVASPSPIRLQADRICKSWDVGGSRPRMGLGRLLSLGVRLRRGSREITGAVLVEFVPGDLGAA